MSDTETGQSASMNLKELSVRTVRKPFATIKRSSVKVGQYYAYSSDDETCLFLEYLKDMFTVQ